MLRFPIALAVLLAAGCGSGRFQGPYHIEKGPERRVRCVLSARCGSPGLRLKAWRVFAMKAPELPAQTAAYTALSSPGFPSGALLRQEKSPLKRAYLQLDVPAAPGSTEVAYEVSFAVTLAPLTLVQGAGREPVRPLSARERADALGVSRTLAWKDPFFQSWMAREKLLRRPGERDLDFAYRAHEHIARTFKPGSSGDYGSGCVVTSVVRAGQSSCGGFSVLFASLMRANGVPARVRFGRWTNGQVHVKADFWAEDVGWVNAESAVAVRDLPSDPGAVEKTFGREEGIFLTFHTDADMILSDLDGREREVPFMQFGGAWWQGEGVEEAWSSTETWRQTEQGT